MSLVNRWTLIAGLVLIVAGLVPADAWSQGRNATKGRPSADHARGAKHGPAYDAQAEWWAPRPYARKGYAPRRAVRKNAPPFCRNRSGHPVHGWEWCVKKGYVRAEARHAWRPYQPSRIVVVRKRPRQVVSPRVVIRADIIVDLLGVEVYRNIESWGRRSGYGGDVVGRWLPYESRGWVLQVSQDGFPLAEFIDRDGDRRIDDVWVYEPDRLQRDRDRYDDRYDDDDRYEDYDDYDDRYDDYDDRYDDYGDRGW